MRQCGQCQLCCKLLPMSKNANKEWPETVAYMENAGILKPGESETWVKDFNKPAGARCKHQRHGKGCMVYRLRPFGCRMWSCQWLMNKPDTAAMSRPDRSHYVVDPIPDFIEYESDGKGGKVPVIQIWCDPDYPDAYTDPALRAFMFERGKEGFGILVRLNEYDGFFVSPPQLSDDGEWHEVRTHVNVRGHSAEEKADALREMGIGIRVEVEPS